MSSEFKEGDLVILHEINGKNNPPWIGTLIRIITSSIDPKGNVWEIIWTYMDKETKIYPLGHTLNAHYTEGSLSLYTRKSPEELKKEQLDLIIKKVKYLEEKWKKKQSKKKEISSIWGEILEIRATEILGEDTWLDS